MPFLVSGHAADAPSGDFPQIDPGCLQADLASPCNEHGAKKVNVQIVVQFLFVRGCGNGGEGVGDGRAADADLVILPPLPGLPGRD